MKEKWTQTKSLDATQDVNKQAQSGAIACNVQGVNYYRCPFVGVVGSNGGQLIKTQYMCTFCQVFADQIEFGAIQPNYTAVKYWDPNGFAHFHCPQEVAHCGYWPSVANWITFLTTYDNRWKYLEFTEFVANYALEGLTPGEQYYSIYVDLSEKFVNFATNYVYGDVDDTYGWQFLFLASEPTKIFGMHEYSMSFDYAKMYIPNLELSLRFNPIIWSLKEPTGTPDPNPSQRWS